MARGAQFRTQVVVLWGGNVLAVRSLAPGDAFALGSGRHVWAFPAQLLGGARHVLVECLATQAQVRAPHHGPQSIACGESTSLCVGRFRFSISTGVMTAPKSWFEAPPTRGGWWLASLLLHLTLLALAAYSPPPMAPEPSTAQEPLDWPALTLPLMVGEAEPEPDLAPPDVAYRLASSPWTIDGASRCGKNTEMGRSAPPRDARYGVSGPKDNPDPHLARTPAPPHTGQDPLPREKKSPTSADHELTPAVFAAAWGRSTALGVDDLSAGGHLWGAIMDDAAGSGLESKRHDPGGKLKQVDVTPRLETASQTPPLPARVVHRGASVTGGLSRSAADRALLPQLGALRACWLRGPSSEPGWARFELDISADGSLQRVRAIQHRVDATVLDCLLDVMHGLVFASATGPASVSYPLTLIPAQRRF